MVRAIVVSVALLAMGCSGPLPFMSGGALAGEEEPVPPDWTFAEDFAVAQLETRPEDPYSVNIAYTLVDGRLYINSRARDMILRSAENIYPVEIEHRLDEHPSVAESAVVGVDHPELGQEVKAIVVPTDGAVVDTGELAGFVAEKLAAFKVPAHWEVRPEPLPRNAAGKVLKNVLTGEADDALVAD